MLNRMRFQMAALAGIAVLATAYAQTERYDEHQNLSPNQQDVATDRWDDRDRTAIQRTTAHNTVWGTNDQLETHNVPTIVVNNQPMNFTTTEPGLVNDELHIPIREFAEQIGATVHWEHFEKAVYLTYNGQTYRLNANGFDTARTQDFQMRGDAVDGDFDRTGDTATAQNNQDMQRGDAATGDRQIAGTGSIILVNDRSYKPIDQLARLLGAEAEWEPDQDRAVIRMDDDMNQQQTQS